MKPVLIILSALVGFFYFAHSQERGADMMGLHALVIWAALLIAGAVS